MIDDLWEILKSALLESLCDAFEWGARHGRPDPRDYPQSFKIRSIGEELCRLGGRGSMLDVWRLVEERDSDMAVLLDEMWTDCGPWAGNEVHRDGEGVPERKESHDE